MHRTLVVFFTLSLVACTTTRPATAPTTTVAEATTAATTQVAAPPAMPQCNPGHTLVNAALWVGSSAEYQAAALSTFSAARRALDAALADPAWIGAEEENAGDGAQPPAIILDLDETAIDNIEYEVRAMRTGQTYDAELWMQWVAEGAAKAVPGATEFLAYAKSRGVTPFYVTNRDFPAEEAGTRANLERLGYPLDSNVDTLLMRGKNGFKGSDKGPRRAFIATSYRVLLLVGDDLNDFTNSSDKTIAERDALIAKTKEWWGTRWFIVPNPMYGSFEKIAVGSGGTPCEKIERKIEAAVKDREKKR